jgi:RNA polymerase sigma-70 factor (ECF subfamily)
MTLPSPQTPPSPGPADGALVRAAIDGQEWAYEALYHRYVQRSFALAARITGSREAARDIVQDAFATAFRKLPSLRNPDAFPGWMQSTVVRTILMAKRRSKTAAAGAARLRTQPLMAESVPPEIRVEFERVQRWLAQIREPDRTIYLLKVVEGCDTVEIAELTGLSLATVKRKVARVDEHLRELGKDGAHE